MTQEITDYLLEKLPKSFDGWTREAVEDYVIHNIRNHQLVAATSKESGRVVGVMTGWSQKGDNVERYNFQESDPDGDTWVWHQWAADDKATAAVLAQSMMARRPECVMMPSVAHRRGRIRKYKPGQPLHILIKAKETHGICISTSS